MSPGSHSSDHILRGTCRVISFIYHVTYMILYIYIYMHVFIYTFIYVYICIVHHFVLGYLCQAVGFMNVCFPGSDDTLEAKEAWATKCPRSVGIPRAS